jgi:hypothetical protein|tara:strand:+ start:1206 stop:1760 length:555 start_codon:yes stop_codon:yes gene_type:complete
MALWGHTSGTESKPNWLSAADKTNTSAKPHGWELKKIVGSRTLTEVLVAWSSSALTTALGAADITDIDWVSTAHDVSAGSTLSVKVIFNEAVDVTGTPQLTVVNDQRANHTLSYASGTGSNELTFSLVVAAASASIAAGDVLSIGANTVALNGGTVKDAGTSTVSTITSVAGIGTAAGTITAVA